MISSSSLSIWQWNCRGIRVNAPELLNFIFSASPDASPDNFQETFLTDNHKLSLKGYNIVRRDRDSRGGGIATCIRSNISFSVRDISDDYESLILEISISRVPLVIVNYYNPSVPIPDNIFSPWLAKSTRIIICGDFNAHHRLWGCSCNDQRGRDVLNIIDSHNLVVLNNGCGTRLNNDGTKSSIDLTLVFPTLASNCSWSVLPYCFGSDHFIVSTNLDCIANQDNPILPRWNFKNADWARFSTDCENSISTVPLI